MRRRSGSMTARKKPVRITVVTAERKIPAETLRFTPAVSPAPYRWAVRIVKPEVSPWAKPVIRNMMIPVEPTAARAPAPTYRPTMIVSAIL